MQKCFFKSCSNPVTSDTWRCDFHRGRDRCTVENCFSQAYARGLCARHGGKRMCQSPGCPHRVRVANFCSKHGVKKAKNRCLEPGCDLPAQSHQLCVRHGGSRRCKWTNCTAYARKGGFCARHTTQQMKEESKRLEETVQALWPADEPMANVDFELPNEDPMYTDILNILLTM
ncbi:unnamed protein product [Aphanomyces euteiches]|uniref:WRKY transcription factor 19 n=1 Tax=Aphanomyces euteiches TaxID=100861 RepID=A0A6G0XQR2_9STRA|nr:hypothetical protein Ae201684_002456 [Aphanomyces euteiches]KAH9087100.1 hypothetical protein Ae201684P_000512 [Aphanomyces euteiches]